MSDRDDDKIVSLDARRRADQARQKAELAAQAAARRKSNGSGRDLNQPFGRPMQGHQTGTAVRPSMGLGGVLGMLVAWIVWGGLIALLALAVLKTVAG